jgi:hypothetical protein
MIGIAEKDEVADATPLRNLLIILTGFIGAQFGKLSTLIASELVTRKVIETGSAPPNSKLEQYSPTVRMPFEEDHAILPLLKSPPTHQLPTSRPPITSMV